MYAKIMSAAALGLLVAACGTDPQERVQGGAAAGAATGAGIGALGGPVGALAGAAIGGGAGAITGAATDSRDVNLGRPVWENPETRVPGVTNTGSRAGAASGTTRQAQQALASRGFNPGPADGIWGERSRQATMDFQRANNIEPSGRLDSRTMAALNVSGARSSSADRDRAYMGGGQVSQTQPGAPMTGPMGGNDPRGINTPANQPGGRMSGTASGSVGPSTTPASPGVALGQGSVPGVAGGQQVPGASRGATPGDVNTGGGSGAGSSGSGGGAGR